MSQSTDYDVMIPFLQSIVFGTGSNQATSYTIQQTNTSVRWIFKQLAVENQNTASTSTTVALYLNGVLLSPSSYLIPTPNGLGAVASGLPYIVLQYSDQLQVSFGGATAGDLIKIQGLYTELLNS